MIKESHDIVTKDNKFYKERAAELKEEMEKQKEIWRQEMDSMKESINSIVNSQ